MTEITESVTLETWSTPNCPFTIEYSRRMLDDIRLAVVDAFFSLPRGGAEIGGVLLGKFADGRVTILEYLALECEHIFGPSFTLSPGDHARLAEMVSGATGQINDLQPVGWYHSHTRSDIFLSDADLDIHNRYFPNPWQVALVLRPSTFQPVQAGFFFREADGTIHAKASYHEFALDPLPVGQVPRGIPAAPPQAIPSHSEPEGPVITLTAAPEPPAIEPEPPREAVETGFVPEMPPTPPLRASSLPPALPPLPRLELVPDPETPSEPAAAMLAESSTYDSAELPIAEREAYFPSDEPPSFVASPAEHEPLAEHPAASSEPVAAWFEPEPAKAFFQPEPAAYAETEQHSPPIEPEPESVPTPLAAEIAVCPEVATDTPPPPQLETAPDSQPVAEREPAPQMPAPEPPSFLQVEPVRPRRRLWTIGIAATVVAVAALGYQERPMWLAQVKEMISPRPAAPAPAPAPLRLPLTATDEQGQLHFNWDSASQAITGARDGILQITDDGTTTDLPLDAAHLRGGAFTYVRFGEHVDARLTIQELDGTQVRAVASFYGALPQTAKTPAAPEAAAPKQNLELAKKSEALAKENADLRQRVEELTNQTAKLKADAEARAASSKQGAALAQQIAELRQQHDELAKQSAKLKADSDARAAAAAKQNAELTAQNNELRQQRDDLGKQTAKLKVDLMAARATPSKGKDKDGQQRDDLLIQIAKLKAELAAQNAAPKPAPNAENVEFSKQRYQLVSRVSQLESDLAVAQARSDRLARQIEELKRQQTQRRLQNQTGDPTQ